MPARRHFGSVRKLPSGRYQANYWHAGKRHTAPDTFKAKGDALAWLSSTETDIDRGAWVDPAGGKLTVKEASKRWLASNSQKRASSRSRDDAILRTHILPEIGERSLSSVTRADIQTLVDAWAAKKAASTVGRQYSALRAMFAWVVASDLLARTPCRDIRVPKTNLVVRPTPDPKALEQLAKALGADQAPMMWLGAVGGLRWAEAAGLWVRDLDLLGSRITVARQLTRKGTIEQPKTRAGARTFALPKWLAEDLSGHLAARGLTGADADALVFTTSAGTALSYTNWRRRVWVPATEKAGLAGLKFHDLRSMAATALVAAGVDVKTAQVRMGHSSPTVTLGIYARMTEAADRAAADAVGASRANGSNASRTQRARLAAVPSET